jgi:hypothetical protein
MTRFSSPEAYSGTEREAVKNTRVFSVLGEFFAIRFKELNTYSDLITRYITRRIGQFRPAFAPERPVLEAGSEGSFGG